jgi:hypothetical protein
MWTPTGRRAVGLQSGSFGAHFRFKRRALHGPLLDRLNINRKI